MPERFGALLRLTRQQAGRTLADVARLLDVSVVYVSDVERGQRRPFGNERIVRIAELLQVDPTPLLTAAAIDKGMIEYVIDEDAPLAAAVVGELVGGLVCGTVTDAHLVGIRAVLQDRHRPTGIGGRP